MACFEMNQGSLAQDCGIAEATMPVLGESRVVWHLAVEAEPTEPAVGEVQVHLFAQPPFGTNAKTVANQQHPHEQLGIDRRPSGRAIQWRHMAPDVGSTKRSIDLSKWVAGTCRSSENS